MSDAQEHVQRFMSPVDPEGGLIRMAELLADLAKSNPKIHASLSAISQWIKKHTEALKSTNPSSEAKTLLAIGYLRALEAVRRSTQHDWDNTSIQKRVTDAPKVLSSLEPDFLTELLSETTARSADDPKFARQLKDALQQFEALAPRLKKFLASATPAQPAGSAARPAIGVRGDYDCGGGIGDALCAGALVVVIVIIVLVAK